jgi:hypothetical protein
LNEAPSTLHSSASLEKALTGARYQRQHIRAALSALQAGEDCSGSPTEELVQSLGDWLI